MQKSKMRKIYDENKSMVWAAVIGLVLTGGILLKVKDEVTRFTLIMPVFAGFILFSILTASDEQLGDTPDEDDSEKKPEVKKKK